jgi:hypothetical protein
VIAAYLAAVILLAFAAVIGQALISISLGVRRGLPLAFSWLAPPVGVAAMLILAGVTARLPGHGITAAIVLVIAVGVSIWWLRGRVSGIRDAFTLGAPVALITLLAASIPFAVAGGVGILGAGLNNDDMASHLLIADHVRDPSGLVPTFVRGGYPSGPHAVVVAISEGTGAGLVEVFAGFTLALAPLTGFLALGLLGSDIGKVRRIVGASLVALTYLGASFISSGAFKEPLQAIILIAFAVILAQVIGMPTAVDQKRRDTRRIRPILRVLPLAVLTAASVFNYSLPGLLWIGAVSALVIAARVWLVKPKPKLPPDWKRQFAPYAIGLLLVVILATVQEWSRIADFARLEALNPERFGSDLGNLKDAISPLESLGIWPTGDYRTTADRAGGPTLLFYAAALFALVALVIGLIDSRKRSLYALPAALVAVAGVWALTSISSTPYIAAKALAIASPLVVLISIRGLLRMKGALGVALTIGFILLAGASSLLALRQASVRGDERYTELAEAREIVKDEPVLFLGRDNFIGYMLAGSGEITGIVANYYSVNDARSRFQTGEGGGEKFDVDALFPQTLDAFQWILSPTGQPKSSPPPRYEPVVETDNYVLYERTGITGRRKTLDEGIYPGAVLNCEGPLGKTVAKGQGTAQVWSEEPVIGGEEKWQPSATATDSKASSQTLELTDFTAKDDVPSRWMISLEYDSRRPVQVTSPELGIDVTLPANLDFRGPSPFFPVAEVEVSEDTAAEISVQVNEPNGFAKLLGAPNEAHLRSVSATPLGVIDRIQRRQACDQYVDWFRAR